MDVATLGIRVDSTGAVKATSDLERLTGVAAKADVATERLATTSKGSAAGFNAGGQGARMMALQLSQVAQQGSVTGNYLGALAVQLPDMATGFGAVGIAAGVVASVALPLLVQWFSNTSSAMDRVQKQMDSLSDASSAYASAVKAAAIPTQELTDKYGALSEAARTALLAMADVSRVEAIQATADAIASLGDALLQTERVNARQIGGTRALADDFGMAADAANRFEAALVALEKAGNLRDQAAAAEQARNALIGAYGSVERMPPVLQQAYKQLAGITVEAASINGTLSKTPSIFGSISAAAGNLAGVLSGVKDQAAGFVGYMQAAYDQALKLSQFTPQQRLDQSGKQYGGRGGDPRSFTNAQANTFGGNTYTPPSSGGGGGADPFQSRLDALRQTLASESQIELAAYTQQQDTLKQALDQRAITQSEYYAMMEQAAQAHQDKMAQIDVYRYGTTLQKTSSFLGDMAGALQGGNEKMLAISKKFGAAQALVNTFTGATEALKLPFPQNLLAFAKVVATGMSAVSAIRSGSSSLGGGGGGKIAAQAAPVEKQTPVEYIVRGIDKSAIYTGEMLSQIFDGISEEAAKRGMATFRFV